MLKSPGIPSHSGAPTNSEIYLQELDWDSTANIREESPHASHRDKEKKTFQKTPEHSVLITSPVLRGN